jgi:regulator of CtrA degradation
MRLTARLTQIMAWLLLQRAINDGEVERASAAAEENRLGARSACLVHDEAALAILPPALQSLLERSHRLYVRVARLDDMIGRDDAGSGLPRIAP